MQGRLGISVLACLLALFQPALAADYLAGPADYRHFLNELKPGDRLVLQPGDYLRGLPLNGLQGLAGQPIIIEGQFRQPPARFVARAGHNTVSLANTEYVVIRNLEMDGRNLPVDAVKAEGHARFVHHITLEDLRITGHGNNQQTVGISTKSPARGWIIRNNVIEGAGTGIYLGNSDGSAPFWDGLIEGNRVVDSLGYNLQIKHQKARPTVLNDGDKPATTVIRNNFFRKSSSSSPEKWARPNVLLGHWPLQGPGSEDRYLVYGNVFLNNPNEALFQAEGRIALYNNVFINPAGDAIHIQPHNDIPRDMDIFYNTVLASGTGISIRQAPDDSARYIQAVSANVISAGRPVWGGRARYNLELPYQPALANSAEISRLSGRLVSLEKHFKSPPTALIESFAKYPEWDRDNQGGQRDISVPGAVFSAQAKYWIQSGDESKPNGH